MGIPGAPSRSRQSTRVVLAGILRHGSDLVWHRIAARRDGDKSTGPRTLPVTTNLQFGSDVVLRYGGDGRGLYPGGRRSRIEPARAVLLPAGVDARQVSQARPMKAGCSTLAGRAQLLVPEVAECGWSCDVPGRSRTVGDVSSPQISGPQQYSLVLGSELQTLPPLVVILQNAGSAGNKRVDRGTTSSGQDAGGDRLDVSAAIRTIPLEVVDIREHPSTCWWWERTAGENRAVCEVVSGPTIPVAATEIISVSLVRRPTEWPQADQVYFGPDHANFVKPSPATT